MATQLPTGWRMALVDPAPSARYETCVVCGKARQVYRGSRLPCHAACLFTEALQDELLDSPDSPGTQARKLGVTRAIIMASYAAARRRRAAQPSQTERLDRLAKSWGII